MWLWAIKKEYDREWKSFSKGNYKNEAIRVWIGTITDYKIWKKYKKDKKTGLLIPKYTDINLIAQIARELEQADKVAKYKQEEIDYLEKTHTQEEIYATWSDIGFKLDELDCRVNHWKETRDEEFFRIFTLPLLEKLNKYLAIKYMKEILRYRRLYHTCEVTFDHTEWLTEIMIEAINKWDPSKCRHFRVFYEQSVRWYYTQCVRKLNAAYLKGVDLNIFDVNDPVNERMFKNIENKYYSKQEGSRMWESVMQHYTVNRNGQLFADDYIFDFLSTLTDGQASFYTNLLQNVGDKNFTQEHLARHLKMSLSTFKRKREELRRLWIEYNKDDE